MDKPYLGESDLAYKRPDLSIEVGKSPKLNFIMTAASNNFPFTISEVSKNYPQAV